MNPLANFTVLDVKLDGDHCWPDLDAKACVVGRLVGISRLAVSTSSGRSTVCFRVELPDGRTVLAETTLRLMQTAIRAIEARETMEESNAKSHN